MPVDSSSSAKSVLSVLIVEDVPEMGALLEQAVNDAPGFRVSTVAKSVREARVELSRHKPDLVLLDEILPGESSGDLFMEITQLGVPVIFVTSLEDATSPVPLPALGRIRKPEWVTFEADERRLALELRKLMVDESS